MDVLKRGILKMNLFKNVLKEYSQNKFKITLSLITIILLSFMTLFVLADRNIHYEKKFKSIENMPENSLILNSNVFLTKEEKLNNNYNVSFYQPNYKSINKSISVALVSDDFFKHGIPYDHDVLISYKNVFDTNILYGDLTRKTELGVEIANAIVIDDTTALKRFETTDAIGRTMILNIDETDVSFTVIAVIKETPVRENYLDHYKTLNKEEYVEDIGYSQAFVFELDINKLTDKKINFSLAQIVSDDKLTEEEIDEILVDLDIDSNKDYPFIASYLLYHKRIKSDYRNSIIANIITLTVILTIVVQIVILINQSYDSINYKKEISQIKFMTVSQKQQNKTSTLMWICIVISGLIISLVITTITLFIIHKSDIFLIIKT